MLSFADLDTPVPAPQNPHVSLRLATQDQVEEALRFGRGRENLLVHCQAGVSRSTAMAIGLVADRMGSDREAESIALVFSAMPFAVPNLLVVRFSDMVLGRGGRLLQALVDHEHAHAPGNGSLRAMGWMAYARQVGIHPPQEYQDDWTETCLLAWKGGDGV